MSAPWIRPPRFVLAALVALAAARGVVAQQVVLPPTIGVPDRVASRPSAVHDAALAALAQGDFAGALELAMQEYGGGMKFGNRRWIDSIASSALVGECHYERGEFAQAIAAYDEALALSAQYPDWLLAVQFPAAPPRPVPGRQAPAWGRSGRGTVPAQLPEEVAIRQQGPDAQQVLQRGGVLAATFDQPIRAQAIMRALVVALYRRGELLGPVGREATAVDGVAQALARRPAPPAHYSQSWIDVAHGTALWAQGKADQAAPLLTRGLTIGQGLDHALTPWGLIVLGRIALDADRAAAAAKQFEEAALAAHHCGDARALEEAFRLAFAAHMLAGSRGVPATIRAAGDTIGPRDGLDVLRARLLAMRAEALAAAGDPRAATAALREIDPRILRGEPGQGATGAEAAYAAALADYAAGDVAAGDAELARALGLARGRSVLLFQTASLVAAVNAGSSIADRQAEELFTRFLGPPAPRDFGVDPLGTLAVISASRHPAFEAWIAVAARRGAERASDAVLDPAEAARRDRWLVARPLGGRSVAAARLLAADPNGLDPATAARRAAILAGRPDLKPLLDRLAGQRATLTAAAEVAAGRPADAGALKAPPGQPDDWTGYRSLADGLARHAARLAAGREAVTVDFPPLTPSAEIRRRLGERQLILSFHWTDRGLTGVLESRDRFVLWDVRQAAGLPGEIAHLARGLCLFDGQAAVGTDKLLASDWRGPAARIERVLFENARVSLGDGIDDLVIVPDGWLWYVPFELLPVSSARAADAGPRPLGEVCRIRYCPTRSLAVAAGAAIRPRGPVGIHAGRMARGDDAATAAAVLARTTGSIDRAVPVVLPASGPPAALVASVFDALAVFDESGPAKNGAVLVPPAAGRGGLGFADWLAPPMKRPHIVLVPGLQTAMADGLKDKGLPPRPGDDVFLPATDLLAAGARTAVISRWRVGGGTCVDLMTEFLREATAPPAEPPESAALFWRRAVDVVTAECPDPQREPRLRSHEDDVLADARHPFLWAGYMLVDCGPGGAPPPPVAALPAGQPAARPPARAPAPGAAR